MKICYLFFLLINVWLSCATENLNSQIYYDLPDQAVSHCIRKLNNSQYVGCSSSSDGDVGVILLVDSLIDLNEKVPKLTQESFIVMYSELFPNSIDVLWNNKNVKGLIVLESNTTVDFSEDYKTPNKRYSVNASFEFNKFGSNYAFKKWPFPVALIKNKYFDIQNKIIKCYKDFNANPKNSLRCAMEIKNFMAATTRGPECIRKNKINEILANVFNPFYFCYEMPGQNFIIYSQSNVLKREDNSVIILTSRMDSLSMFERSGVGVNGELTSTAILLSVMKLLMSTDEFKNEKDLKKDVLFLLLDNESYDYMGTKQFYHDLQNGKISNSTTSSPIKTNNIDLILEFGELAFINYQELVFYYPNWLNKTVLDRQTQHVKNLNAKFVASGFNVSSGSQYSIPPSSIQYILKQNEIPSILIADHLGTFKNPYYNSFFDKQRADTSNVDELNSIVNTISSFVFKEATGKELKIKMNSADIASPNNIVDCFSENLDCELIQLSIADYSYRLWKSLGFPIPAQAHYGSKKYPSSYRFSYLIQDPLVVLSSPVINNSYCENCTKDCNSFYSIRSVNNTFLCFNTSRVDKYNIDSATFDNPLWFFSGLVGDQSVRMFIITPNSGLLATGITIFIISFIIMVLLTPNYWKFFV